MAALWGWGGASAAHAGDSDEGAEALAVDVARDAAESGLDPDVLAEQVAFQVEVDALLDPLIEKYADTFATAGFTDDGDAYVVFTGPVPREVEVAIADQPRITARGDALLSEGEAAEINEAVAQAVADVLPDDGELMTLVEPETGEVEIAITEGRSESRVEVAAVEAYEEAAPDDVSDLAQDAVTVDVDRTLENIDEAASGGQLLANRGNSSLRCTSAFTAKHGSNIGVLTAKHCPENLTVNSGDNLYNASLFTSNSAGDAQWHRSKTGGNAQFRYDWGKYRNVGAHPVLKVGTRVCRFGAATGTGSGCDTVKYVSACTKYPNLTYTICDLAMTESTTGSAGGDSGGPWFYGANAYGIHSGTNVRDGYSRNWFTSSRKALAAMGLKAVTG